MLFATVIGNKASSHWLDNTVSLTTTDHARPSRAWLTTVCRPLAEVAANVMILFPAIKAKSTAKNITKY